MTLDQVLASLTIEQAKQWQTETDKWVYVADNILEQAGLRAIDKTVNAVEDALDALLGGAYVD
jgi:HD superfamily phosphohydrolase YqeK